MYKTNCSPLQKAETVKQSLLLTNYTTKKYLRAWIPGTKVDTQSPMLTKRAGCRQAQVAGGPKKRGHSIHFGLGRGHGPRRGRGDLFRVDVRYVRAGTLGVVAGMVDVFCLIYIRTVEGEGRGLQAGPDRVDALGKRGARLALRVLRLPAEDGAHGDMRRRLAGGRRGC